MKIRFNRPTIGERELDYVREALTQDHLGVDGPFTKRCEAWLAERLGSPRAHLVNSGTGGLDLAALLAEVGPGDEVVMPAFTFASCANSVALRGAVPVFVDIRPDTLNIDPNAVEAAITSRTKAILPVHYAGVPCDMDPIRLLAERYGLVVIEDAAPALLSTYRGRPAGNLGHLGVISFGAQKNITGGEAGALLVNDPRYLSRAEIMRSKGTDRAAFVRGERKQFTWVDLGSAFAPGEIVAALLFAQLERADEITRARRQIWQRYHAAFAQAEAAGRLRRPVAPSDVEHNGHIYYLLLETEATRDRFIAAMAARGITTPFHFIPLDTSAGGRCFGRAHGDLAVTHDRAARLVRLPLWVGLEPIQDRVIEAVLAEVGAKA